MNHRPSPARPRPPAAALLAVLLAGAPPASAKVPTLDYLYPAGGQRGRTVEVAAGGNVDPWPPRVRVEGRGVVVEPAAEKGKLTVTVAPDAPLGPAWVRLYNEEGASALRPFVVGHGPEVVEAEPNDDPAKAQPVEGPAVTVNGRLDRRGDVDGFAVTLAEGQTLVASLLANRVLGSPMDALLQVATPEGFVLAHEDDGHGLDPQLVFRAPHAGTFVVRTFAFPAAPDSSIRFASGDAYVYRLTLSTAGFVDYPSPLAVPRDDPGPVEVVGWNVPDEARTLSVGRREESAAAALLAHPALTNPAEVRFVPHPSLLEREPNPVDAPQPIEPPVSVTGLIETDGDQDAYRFAARKDERRLVRVESRSLGFPLDPTLRVLDASGKVLAEVDDTGRDGRDAELAFTAPADGEYRLVVRDLNGRGGPRHAYRLDVVLPRPDFHASVASDRFTLTPDKPLEIPVTLALIDGFDGDVILTVEGLPEGVAVEQAAGPAADQAPRREGRRRRQAGAEGQTTRAVTLRLTGRLPAAWSGPIRVVGHDPTDDLRSRPAEFALEGLGAASGHGWLTILPPTTEGEAGEAPSGEKADPSD